MLIDNSLSFNTNWQTTQAITSTAQSATVIDITGAGSGVAPTMTGGNGLNTAIGVDIGQGDGMAIPYVVMSVVAAFTTGDAATLTVSLSAAPDNGSYSPGTYTILHTSPVFTAANLAAGLIYMFQVPPRALSGQPGEALPRFYRLTYTVGTGTFTGGTVKSGILLNPPNGLVNTLYPSNFTSV